MLRHLLDIPEDRIPKMLDATDALAVALTHYYETGEAVGGQKVLPRGRIFLARNPDRIAETPRVIDHF